MKEIRLKMLTSSLSHKQELAEVGPGPTGDGKPVLWVGPVCVRAQRWGLGHAWAGLRCIGLSHIGLVGRLRDCFSPPCLPSEAGSRTSFRVSSTAVKCTFNHCTYFFQRRHKVQTKQDLLRKGSVFD